MDGICTLANDRVYDQLVALLNSIEVILGKDFPVCVFPYDEQTDRVAREIARRPNVELYSDWASIERWEAFARAAWDTHPTAFERWKIPQGQGYYRLGMHRRFCAFDGPFDRFIYMDADTLLLDSVDSFFSPLDQYDCVVYDYQFKDITHVYENKSPKLTEIFSAERLETEIFCAGVYASKKGIFNDGQKAELIHQLKAGEAEILYPLAPDQTLVNYMMMRASHPIYNYAFHISKEKRVGNCVTSLDFVERDHLLYDKGYRIPYLHYIGLSSQLFNQACAGGNIDFPYRNLFLYYRYLHEPEKRPHFTTEPVWYIKSPSLVERLRKTLSGIRNSVLR